MHPVLFHIGAVLIPAYGASAALGVLLALGLVLRTARMCSVDPGRVWSLCIWALFSALVAARVLLIAANWTVLRSHPRWLFGLGAIHHPLVAAAGLLAAAAVAAVYARLYRLALRPVADALAAPLALGLAFEQLGELLAGSSFGTEASLPWAVIYTSPLAELWSGAPIGIPVHPVQAYAALAFLALAAILFFLTPPRLRSGDVAGIGLMGVGVAVFTTEFWRDPLGRGSLLGGAIDGPQAAAVLLLLAGALMLAERPPKYAAETVTIRAKNDSPAPEAPENTPSTASHSENAHD